MHLGGPSVKVWQEVECLDCSNVLLPGMPELFQRLLQSIKGSLDPGDFAAGRDFVNWSAGRARADCCFCSGFPLGTKVLCAAQPSYVFCAAHLRLCRSSAVAIDSGLVEMRECGRRRHRLVDEVRRKEPGILWVHVDWVDGRWWLYWPTLCVNGPQLGKCIDVKGHPTLGVYD